MMARSTPSGARHAYLLLSPLGLAHAGELMVQLAQRQLLPCARIALTAEQWRWVDTAAHLGPMPRLHRLAAYERAWHSRFSGQGGELWSIAPQHLKRLVREKRSLRAPLPDLELTVRVDGIDGALHAFHVPDPEQWKREAARVEATLQWLRVKVPKKLSHRDLGYVFASECMGE